MAKQLFVREITYRAYVYMDPSDTLPCEFDGLIVRDAMEADYESLETVEPNTNPLCWDLDCLVYHEYSHDLPLRRVLP